MKMFLGGFFFLALTFLLLGCSPDEVSRVGTPFNENGSEGVIFDKDITDSESIESLREVIKKLKDIEEPEA